MLAKKNTILGQASLYVVVQACGRPKKSFLFGNFFLNITNVFNPVGKKLF
jgi:hypothetical protein